MCCGGGRAQGFSITEDSESTKPCCRGSLKMDAPKETQPTGEFKCQLCGLTAPYMYYGQKPPNTRSIVLLEESYVMKDPFIPDKDKFLILGSHCSLCTRSVCVGTLIYSSHPTEPTIKAQSIGM
ncbi:cysteine-rich DPF motif domain-containing protein 1 isoform X3 [Nyctibius grandis]|uniref:cysteine-rich DPF motif domain-containing protein 1 isoform X3 n=1 Tax=Nyctibius grandis TaxID=48427 RepID=UPI0035BC77FD